MAVQHEQVKVLALDTSTSTMALALLQDRRTAAQLESQAERNHSLKLVPAMQSMLKGLGWEGSDLSLLAVGIGPGSYTGVRISVTAAKTMAWAWGKPVVGVSSLHALALSGLEAVHKEKFSDGALKIGRDWVYPLVDARRGQVYTARFRTGTDTGAVEVDDKTSRQEPEWDAQLGYRVQEDGIRLFSQVAEEVAHVLQSTDLEPADMPEHVWFVGEIEPHMERIAALQEQFGDRIHAVPCMMKAHWIGRIGSKAFHQGEIGDTHRLEPNYTQLTEAESKLLAKEQAAAKAVQQS
ncbi:tRNA (adenosine(37)-N6)-threonylcarbamoyltransferase complex dimerization subunit type 1 TsaB [Paenibacillus sp. MER 180]|uniref:tRNA (adenosine(37)-N6)-threonylcarbamoyltransferase complex dimerization subunit type 1 TsaB n=1 Tax=Paenibacillus sp. MER 180 TaxID=2939570 RepID=UPI00203FC379|nr:tRNA (adenosine(37)-N6)-threonylcarbamoyltransferase complex dimerization subunit type 1 TsaB [Paenibacillus sp. MER 180]MCM3292827.1 tRNA (adenosine(37)-N6)-threonylcarbamoyltransferase complex dimerization subunit type 1 TsaB [Paenibacillus sp. MER 180]